MRRSVRIGALLLACCLLPPVTAMDGPFLASSIQHDGETWMQATAGAVRVHQQSDQSDLYMTIRAEHMDATQFNRTYYHGPTVNAPAVGALATYSPVPQESAPRNVQVGPVNLTIALQELHMQMMILAPEAGSFDLRSTTMAPISSPTKQASYGPSGLSTANQDESGYDRDHNGFSTGSIEGPFSFTEASHVPASLYLEGDLILEVRGLDLWYDDGSGPHRLYASTTTAAVHPEIPTVFASYQHEAFLRVRLQDARLTLTGDPHEGGKSQFVLREMDSISRGGAVLQDALLVGGSGSKSDVRIADNEVLHADPRAEALHVAPADADTVAEFAMTGVLPQNTMADPSRGPGAVGVLAVFGTTIAICLAALAVFVLRMRAARKVDMPHIEAALESGQYREAARLARRVHRRDPFRDGPAIALAVAYTRGGRPIAAVRSARRHLRLKEPGDGVLHYVMGMALLDLGRRKEAQEAMEEAVERTPALSDEVAERLGYGPVAAPSTEGVAYV